MSGDTLSFFFSSRRRHTRSTRDWSSDVCSSDLNLSQRRLCDKFGRSLCNQMILMIDPQYPIFREMSDARVADLPLVKNSGELLLVVRRNDEYHAFLRLADHNLRRAHVGLAGPNFVEVDLHAHPSLRGHLRQSTSQTSAPKVFHSLNNTGINRLQDRFDDQFLGERVRDLDSRSFAVRSFC